MNNSNVYNISSLISDEELYKCSKEELLEELIKTRTLCNALDTIIENSIDAIYIADGNANTIRVNKAYEKLCGMKRQDLIGKNLRAMEGDIISKSCSLEVLKSKKPFTAEQHFIKTGRTAFISSNPVFDAEGNITIIVSNNRDFTEIEALRTQLHETEDRANKYQSELEIIKSQLLAKSNIIAQDKKMLDVLLMANKLAKVDSSTLILGDTGVGKEELAKYIHANSFRSDKPFIKINCGAIPANLIESELFGYEKGAFTGANSSGKMGLFEAADHGTIFLDEIGELPLDMQVKLLRVLQEREIERIGGTKPIKVDIRVIAATNRDLKEMIYQKLFREDLFYRLNVVPIEVPPLNERPDDIIPLSVKFLEILNEKYKFNKTLSNSAYKALKKYTWPGNVRELKNIIEQASIMSNSSMITADDLPFNNSSDSYTLNLDKAINLKEVIEKLEFQYITKAYDRCNNVRDASKLLNMKTTTYVRKRKSYLEKWKGETFI